MSISFHHRYNIVNTPKHIQIHTSVLSNPAHPASIYTAGSCGPGPQVWSCFVCLVPLLHLPWFLSFACSSPPPPSSVPSFTMMKRLPPRASVRFYSCRLPFFPLRRQPPFSVWLSWSLRPFPRRTPSLSSSLHLSLGGRVVINPCFIAGEFLSPCRPDSSPRSEAPRGPNPILPPSITPSLPPSGPDYWESGRVEGWGGEASHHYTLGEGREKGRRDGGCGWCTAWRWRRRKNTRRLGKKEEKMGMQTKIIYKETRGGRGLVGWRREGRKKEQEFQAFYFSF